MSVHRLRDGHGESPTTIPIPPFRWRTRILLPLSLLGAAAGLLAATSWRTWFPGTPVRVAPVIVKTVDGPTLQGGLTASGWLEPDPYPVYVTALVSGIVDSVHVLEGQSVEKGELVASLVDDDAKLALASAESDFAVADADRERAKAALSAAEEDYDHRIDRRDTHRESELHVSELDARLAAVEKQQLAAAAKLARLIDEQARKRGLVESGAVSAGEFQRLGLDVDAARANVEAIRQRGVAVGLERDRAIRKRDAAKEHLDLAIIERRDVAMARAELARAIAVVQREHVRVDEAKLALERTQVRSPVAGIVLKRLVAPGSRVAMMDSPHAAHIVHLYDPKHLQVRVDVPLADAAKVGLEQAAEVTLQVLPNVVFHGTVSRLVHEADLQKNTIEVKVAITDPNPILKPEMLARVRFLEQGGQSESRSRVFAPERGIRESSDGAVAWLAAELDEDRGVAERRSIELGPMTLDRYREIKSGLRPGDRLILDPPADLNEGARVVVTEEDPR